MDVLFREGEATGERIMELIPDSPSYSATRSILRILERKGCVDHRKEGRKYIFFAAMSRERAKRSAIRHLLGTLFDNSPESVLNALMDVSAGELTDDDIERMTRMIEKHKLEGGG
jgi:predicted transcriptional regulator